MNRLFSFSMLALALALAALVLSACSLAEPAPASTGPSGQTAPVNSAPAAQQSVQLPTRRPVAADGASIFAQKCSACHGDQGRGDGPQAAQIQSQTGTPPADLTSDPVARAETPEQWFDVVSNGRMDKLMPPFSGSLSPDQRWDVIAYIWTLSAPPSEIDQGKSVYTAQCVQCHGQGGKGDGPDAKGALPDFTQFSTIASVEPGRWDQALSSTHVPSFAGTLSDAERRAVVDYIRTFVYDVTGQPAIAAAATPGVTSTTGISSTVAPASVVEGYVLNGTAGGPVPGNMEVTFYVIPNGNTQSVISRTLQTDAQGRFTLTDVQASHGDPIAATVLYHDIQFPSDVATYGTEPTITLPITIYETTSDTANVQIDALHIIATPDANGLQVDEIYALSNTGDRAVANPGQAIMHLDLPAGAINVTPDPSMVADTLTPNANGLDFYGYIPVGTSNAASIAFSYQLPGTKFALDRTLFQNVKVVNVLIAGAPDQVQVSGDNFMSGGTQDFSGQTYQLYQATNLAPGQQISLTVGSGGAVLDWRVLLGGLLIVAGAAGLAIWFVRQRRRLAPGAIDARAQQDALLDQIAALDDAFEAGEIDKVDYNARRTRLKARLVKLMERDQ